MKFIQRDIRCVDPVASLKERVLSARGADPDEQMTLSGMLPPAQMKDLERAAAIVLEAIKRGLKICVVGDYDADGATATAILMRGLRMFGADPFFIVPNRFTDGYGLSTALVERAAESGARLIVTVDNGIAAVEGVERAAKLKIPVVVTDHHLAGDVLPPAAAIVNPNQPGCDFPSKALAGCGVAFYLLIAMRMACKKNGDPRGAIDVRPLLDIVALGTVADVVPLDRNNRLLVAAGLRQIREGRACAGIAALFDVTAKPISSAGATDLAFYIAVRINACGRMDDAGVGIRCLIEDDPEEAAELARQLHETNLQRRSVQEDVQAEAETIAAGFAGAETFAIVVADEGWHEGIIGIVAGRLKERFRRPSIVFTASEGGALKGSGRSIPALHMRDALAAVNARHPGMILKFGGHAMAAGLTIGKTAFDDFQAAFESEVRSRLRIEDFDEVIEHDGPLSARDLTLENAEWVRQGVWGAGFPEPSFVVKARVLSQRVLKDKHSKFLLDVEGEQVDAILFNEVVSDRDEITVHGKLDVNEWKGNRSVQLILSHAGL